MRGFDMTQAKLAERIGISQNYSLECGKSGDWGGDPA
jgi:DNA-binding XRE family transcriptional regulator